MQPYCTIVNYTSILCLIYYTNTQRVTISGGGIPLPDEVQTYYMNMCEVLGAGKNGHPSV